MDIIILNLLFKVFAVFGSLLIFFFKFLKKIIYAVKSCYIPENVPRFQMAANTATILAAIVTSLSLGFGYYQFVKNQELNCSSKATDLFLKFTELKAAIEDQQIPPKGLGIYWKFNNLLAITGAIFILTEGDSSWGETVKWMVNTQERFISSGPLLCGTYDDNFVKLLKQEVPQLICQ